MLYQTEVSVETEGSMARSVARLGEGALVPLNKPRLHILLSIVSDMLQTFYIMLHNAAEKHAPF